MLDAPSNLDIARQIGISETDVALYRSEIFRLGDGSWLIHFSFAMPRELRQNLTGSFTFIMGDKKPGDRRVSEPD